jgi:hypothetical protein
LVEGVIVGCAGDAQKETAREVVRPLLPLRPWSAHHCVVVVSDAFLPSCR